MCEQNNRDMGRAKEIPNPIQQLSIVIPACNEEVNLQRLQASLESQKASLEKKYPDVNLNIIISDNGSTDNTKEIASQLGTVTADSRPGSIGSARRVGVEQARKINTEHEPNKHVMIFLDADTVMQGDSYLASIYETFSRNADLMVSFGPVAIKFSNGVIIQPPIEILRKLRDFKLKRRFSLSGRRIREFLKPPYDIFPGYSMAIRESAYANTSGFHDEDTAAEDIRMSLELKQALDSSQIYCNPQQAVLTSGRSLENADGKISPKRVFEYWSGRYISYGQRLNEGERSTPQALMIVRDFIQKTEKKAYSLTNGEYVAGIISQKSLSRMRRGRQIRPAINHTTNEIIPGRFAIIERH